MTGIICYTNRILALNTKEAFYAIKSVKTLHRKEQCDCRFVALNVANMDTPRPPSQEAFYSNDYVY